ncbi:hypothetical protein DDZ13_04245 [Coraliomargarita sinensis]|uniref:Uncharacterized protein n=1 Tax=Coraliomargarita sinensis TaxID=2174842 RepID=A0A317ZMK3_9BACT|nr:hypothetical protein [Coraliomargarita sinensis]PXA05178.1 hypothetical protein DDZ13_04245 [Coraliomargarita sinensis]
MNHTCLTGQAKHTPAFYYNALKYGHFLWQQGHAGRAVLAITRALYADISEEDPILSEWPLPYAALLWIFENHRSDDFPGNPRVSFQHQATRLRGPRKELRRARAWATWALVCQARPDLKGDPHDPLPEPTHQDIRKLLEKFGHSNEASLWRQVIRLRP